MTIVSVLGKITPEHTMVVDLPELLPSGNVRVTIEVLDELNIDEPLFTVGEWQDLIDRPKAKTGAELASLGLAGTWKHLGIEDSVVWLEEQRQKRAARLQW